MARDVGHQIKETIGGTLLLQERSIPVAVTEFVRATRGEGPYQQFLGYTGKFHCDEFDESHLGETGHLRLDDGRAGEVVFMGVTNEKFVPWYVVDFRTHGVFE